MVNFGMKGPAHLVRVSRKIDEHTAWINHVDPEAVGPKPARNRVEIELRYPEFISEFVRREPFVKVRGIGVVQLVDELLDLLFLLWRTMQLEQHVSHWEVVVDFAAIIVIVCFVVS